MNEHYPRVRIFASHGAPILREGITICFYMRRSHHEVARAVQQSMDAYLRTVGPHTLAWYTGQDDWQMLDAHSWDSLRHKFLEKPWPCLELKDDPAGVHGFGMEYYGKWFEDPRGLQEPDMVSALGFWLPTEFLEAQGPVAVRNLALELADPLPFCSGHAGLSFHAVHGYRETEEKLSQLCLRYPGMDVTLLRTLSWKLGARVKGPAWLTFLGQPALGEVRGIDGLRARLFSPSTTVQQLQEERAIVTLGPWPKAGDTEAGDHLPAYRELASVLEPALYRSSEPWSPYFPKDTWQRWERRFVD
ncbi:DUF3396 domain-containing protein [Stigmatella sp. ncwal1]|uniref:DUF3396 domain-containing protein n=1 Tax=Stigmatella ashevillensis TaxID=2995309 RepID=A0ABT5D646_9BACT|nr:type VI immunity family protein [Stigmatella ashevillena]MDC0708575.1 DUF3396 domain-containing protein [Stigmatella ashevillena]